MPATVSLRKPLFVRPQSINPFVARSYRILLLTVGAIAGLGFISYHCLPKSSLAVLGAADFLIWVLCGWLGWRRPLEVVLPLFSIITGLFLGQVAHLYASVFAMATVISLGAFIGLSVYAHVTRKDFSYLRAFLWAAFFILLSSFLVVPLAQNNWVSLGYSAFGSFTFLCWILYDTSQIIHRANSDLTPGIAAFELLLDIIGLHRWLLDLLESAVEAIDF